MGSIIYCGMTIQHCLLMVLALPSINLLQHSIFIYIVLKTKKSWSRLFTSTDSFSTSIQFHICPIKKTYNWSASIKNSYIMEYSIIIAFCQIISIAPIPDLSTNSTCTRFMTLIRSTTQTTHRQKFVQYPFFAVLYLFPAPWLKFPAAQFLPA